MARAAHLRVRPALVRRLCDRGGARRARRPRRRPPRTSCCPISLAIAALLAIVVLSYRQTVLVYESSGGAYVVAKENLGRLPSLVAAAALLTDYVLTVAVSVAAGVLALTSAVPSLARPRAGALARVRRADRAREPARRQGGRDPVRAPDLCVRRVDLRARRRGARSLRDERLPAGDRRRTRSRRARARSRIFVVLRAFASGSTALTGVEAIANGVNAFRMPHGRNAAATLGVLGTIAIAMFVGVSWLAVHIACTPDGGRDARRCSRRSRAATFPSSSALRVHVLGRSGADARRARARREHVVPGLPAARGAARPRRLLRAPVHEPRRPPRLLQRDHRAHRRRLRAARGSTTRASTRSSTST